MIAYAILIIAILTYIFQFRKISLLLFVLMATNVTSMFPHDYLTIKWIDMAVIYTAVILPFSLIFERNIKVKHDTHLLAIICVFIIFMVLSLKFSQSHYGFKPIHILQGSRQYFLILSYFFLIKNEREDIEWVIRMLFYITLVHSVLYIMQVMMNIKILPYGEVRLDRFTKLPRYYNYPYFLDFFILLTTLNPRYLKSWFAYLAPILLFATLLATQNRLALATNVAILLVGLLLKGNVGTIMKSAIFAGLVSIPFLNYFAARIAGEDTIDDIKAIMEERYIDNVLDEKNTHGGTLTYRFAWFYERNEYLKLRGNDEKFFGMGFISEQQFQEVNRFYDFKIGLYDENLDVVSQLTTPDIAYGNLLTRFGYGGGTIVLLIWAALAISLFKRRKIMLIYLVAFLTILLYFLISFVSIYLSEFSYFILPFMILATNINNEEDSTYRLGFR